MSWNFLYILDALMILSFAISYYLNCYRKRYRIDFWHAQLLLLCVIPYMFMLPFSDNELNSLIVGRDFERIVAVIPIVFPICVVGYLFILIGGSLWSLRLGIGARKTVAQALNIFPQCSMMLMSSRAVLVFLSLLCFISQLLMLSVYFASSGFGFDLRSYTFANPGVRPIAQIIALSTVILASHCLARYVEKKEKILLVFTLLLSLGLVFFGQRGNIIGIYLGVVLCYLIQRRDKISLFRIIGSAVVSVLMIFYLGNLRGGDYSLQDFFSSIIFLALFGNNFCDLRDFAWIYSSWNHEFWLGKTYLAGLATFIPRGASDFRGEWSFGVATDLVVGLDPLLHPGLKPGQFGETFFNFGLLGVIGVGLIFGIILRRVDLDVKKAVQSPHPSMMRAFASTSSTIFIGCVVSSLTFPAFYALCFIYLASWLCLRVLAIFRPHMALSFEVS